MTQQQKEPLVFGDPEQPLTVGVFVRWLEEHFNPHMEKEIVTADFVSEINIALLGNGKPEESISHKVGEMWRILEKADAYMDLMRLMGRWTMGLASFAAIVIGTLHTLGKL